MSTTPLNLLSRIAEIKRWGEVNKERLLNERNVIEQTKDHALGISRNISSFPAAGLTSQQNSSGECTFPEVNEAMNNVTNRDEHLEKKPNDCEDHGIEAHNRFKRPFLRRWSGLARYRMKPGDQIRPNKRFPKRPHEVVARKNNFNESSEANTQKNGRKSVNFQELSNTVSPLKKPDLKFKAFWSHVDESIEKQLGEDLNEEVSKDFIHQINKHIVDCENDAETQIPNVRRDLFKQSEEDCRPIEPKQGCPFDFAPKIPVTNDKFQNNVPEITECLPSEQSIYEKFIDRELLIFEALEERAANSSFCSTSSSVMRILMSTPNKLKDDADKRNHPIIEEVDNVKDADGDDISGIHVISSRNDENVESDIKNVQDEIDDNSNTNEGVTTVTEQVNSIDLHSESDKLQENELRQLIYAMCKNGGTKFEQEINEEIVGSEHNSVTHTKIEEITSRASSLNSDNFKSASDGSNCSFNDEEYWSSDSSSGSSDSTDDGTPRMERTIVDQNGSVKEKDIRRVISDKQSDVLKKLEQLNAEIEEVRRENSKVQKRRLQIDKEKEKLDKEKREFAKEKKAFEKYVLKEKIDVEFYLEEEKKSLAKEKMVFERYVKDFQNRKTRKERDEISRLKTEVEGLKECSKLKDAKNGATQARLRTQIKSYEREVASLKEELENLRKQNVKLQSVQKNSRKNNDTKMLHEINKNLSKLTKDVLTLPESKPISDVTNKRKFYLNGNGTGIDANGDGGSEDFQPSSKDPKDNLKFGSDFHSQNVNQVASRKSLNLSENENVVLKSQCENENRNGSRENDKNVLNGNKLTENDDVVKAYERAFGLNSELESNNNELVKKCARNETVLPDGSTQISYLNGNKKIICPNGNFIVTNYYNGDIKEINQKDGSVRYYYATNDLWHTTRVDGTEFYEFSDGQVEKHSKDGTVEVRYPNGNIKTTSKDGFETTVYPDGSKMEVGLNDEKILWMSNGQKEIHNDRYKCREYPDGTVKYLYPDSTQETRYSNGRIRIRDPTGKLVMDTHDSTSIL